MSDPYIVAVSARALPGSVMGSAQATTLLKLRVQNPPQQAVDHAKGVLAAQLPRWMTPVDSGAHSGDQVPAGVVTLALLSDLIQAVQLEAGIAVSKSLPVQLRALKGADATLYLPSQHYKATEIAINWASEVLNALLAGGLDFDLIAALDKAHHWLKPFAEQGVNNFFILQASYATGVPVFRPVQGLLVLGTGCRSRWLKSLISEVTPMLGMQFAQGKPVTAALLHAAGLPGGIHHLVTTREQAMAAAEALGYPVVVKPADADRGAGVAAGLTSAQSVALAYDAAVKVSLNVLVERWAPGDTHRLTVQDGQVIRVVRRIAGGVVGDGVHMISELVGLFQQTPQQQRFARRLGHQPLSLDDEAMALLGERGLTAQSRPEEGAYIKLRRRDNVNAGGTNEELAPGDPCVVHPDNVRLAIEAARVLRLDFSGIDLITTDIAQSWLEVGALICEVNACPQMGGTNDPGLYQEVLARMFPSGAEIPAELLVVPAQPLEQERIKDRLLRECSGVPVSLASGLWIDGRRSTPAFKHSFDAAQSLLQRREAHYAICCMTANDIHQFGLPLRKWDAVRVVADAVFTHEEAELLVGVRDWLQAAMPRA